MLRGLPTAVVLAARDEALGRTLRELFSGPAFRCYSSTDVTGVEMGGALKNVMAIAAGAVSGPVCGAIIRVWGNPHLGMLFVAACVAYMLWASFKLRIGNFKK